MAWPTIDHSSPRTLFMQTRCKDGGVHIVVQGDIVKGLHYGCSPSQKPPFKLNNLGLTQRLHAALFESFSLFQCRQYTKCLHRIKTTEQLHVATDLTQIYKCVFSSWIFTHWIQLNRHVNVIINNLCPTVHSIHLLCCKLGLDNNSIKICSVRAQIKGVKDAFVTFARLFSTPETCMLITCLVSQWSLHLFPHSSILLSISPAVSSPVYHLLTALRCFNLYETSEQRPKCCSRHHRRTHWQHNAT